MKNIYFLIITTLITIACSAQNNKTQIIKEFYDASNNYNFNEILSLTYDTVTIVDGDYKVAYDRLAYYKVFQWDSVFAPHYTIVMGEQSGSDVFVKISTTSKRFEFLNNSPLITTHRISFTNNKISKIELIEYVETDFKIWVSKRDNLVSWIKENHAELNGFIHDMTKIGAENYLKAIELYKRK